MGVFGWDYPPGVTGNEWQIVGPEEVDCPQCGGLALGTHGEFKCGDCGHEFTDEPDDFDEPDFDEEFEYDDYANDWEER